MKHDAAPESEIKSRFLMQRREFLVLGSAAVVGVAATGLSGDVLRVAGLESSDPSLAVGFCNGFLGDSADTLAPSVADHVTYVPGAAFNSGNARVIVEGFWRAEANRTTPIAVGLTAYYPVTGGKAPFHGWVYSASRNSVSSSLNPVRFTVPVRADESFDLELSVNDPSESNRVTSRINRFLSISPAAPAPAPELLTAAARDEKMKGANKFVSLATQGSVAPRLQRGTYILALRKPGDRGIDWSSVRISPLTAENKSAGPLGKTSFDYVVVSIDQV